uniref:Superoxide dismutase copper/zinc binding domain-containing protein n=1 Tax=Takifugu rubripes TaxID=31033 RepID=A0A674P049_TAKRU
MSRLFERRPDLDDLSLTVQTCEAATVCAVVSGGDTWLTQQARFYGPIAGNVYIRLRAGRAGAHILSDLATNGQIAGSPGHWNPLAWNTSNNPAPGAGTVDQYEIGDISGKFGMLSGLNQYQAVYLDPSLPLTGPYSIVGRSLVVHYLNGSRAPGRGSSKEQLPLSAILQGPHAELYTVAK